LQRTTPASELNGRWMLAWRLEKEVRVTSHVLIRTVSDVFVLTFRLELRFRIQAVQLTTETCRTASLTPYISSNYTYTIPRIKADVGNDVLQLSDALDAKWTYFKYFLCLSEFLFRNCWHYAPDQKVDVWIILRLVYASCVLLHCIIWRHNATRSSLTFWRRNYFFLILAHTVYKMWIIQEPNTPELWNKLHFEEKKT